MGADGHIASLFPSTDPSLDAPKTAIRLTPDPLPPEAPFDRLSWTLPALLDNTAAMLTIKGADKLAIIEAAATGAHDLPIARYIAGSTSPLHIFGSET
jgi:6-phosphogluconolactonase